MDYFELKDKIYWNNVPDSWYSLDDGLKTDALILRNNHGSWEYFYHDEKGGRHDFQAFAKQEDAFDYLWKKIENDLKFFKIKPRER